MCEGITYDDELSFSHNMEKELVKSLPRKHCIVKLNSCWLWVMCCCVCELASLPGAVSRREWSTPNSQGSCSTQQSVGIPNLLPQFCAKGIRQEEGWTFLTQCHRTNGMVEPMVLSLPSSAPKELQLSRGIQTSGEDWYWEPLQITWSKGKPALYPAFQWLS